MAGTWSSEIECGIPDWLGWYSYHYKPGDVWEVLLTYYAIKGASGSKHLARNGIKILNSVDTKALLEKRARNRTGRMVEAQAQGVTSNAPAFCNLTQAQSSYAVGEQVSPVL